MSKNAGPISCYERYYIKVKQAKKKARISVPFLE